MKTALLLIATGQRYWDYAMQNIVTANEYFVDHDTILFTDLPFTDTGKIKTIRYSHYGFPQASYRRYEAFAGASEILGQYDQLFFSDADMKWVASVTGDEIFSDGITATEHPGYVGSKGTPEIRLESAAYCPGPRTYFCGGFNGGAAKDFLDMSYTIKENIDEDEKKGIMALWHDESHLNKYLYDNPPMRILSPSFCYPESEFKNPGGYYRQIWDRAGIGNIEPKLLALDKGKKQ